MATQDQEEDEVERPYSWPKVVWLWSFFLVCWLGPVPVGLLLGQRMGVTPTLWVAAGVAFVCWVAWVFFGYHGESPRESLVAMSNYMLLANILILFAMACGLRR